MKQGWEHKTLGDCFSFIKNGANIKQDKSFIGIPITRIETLSNGIFNRDKLGYAGITDPTRYEAYILKDKDILLSHINSKAYIGRTVVYHRQNDETIIHGMNLLRLVPNQFLISDFFQYLTLSRYFKDNIARHRKDAVNQSSISITDLKKILIPVPSIDEQKEICSLLDKMNRVIEAKKEQLKELDNLAQAIFYDMFGDPTINDKGWQMKKLCEVGEIVAGSTPSTNDSENWDGDVNWVTPAELGKQLFYGSTQRKLTQKGSRGLTLMPVGTVLLSSRAPIGKLAITTEPMCCNQGFKNVICNDCINNIFLYHYLLYTMEKVQALGVGATFKEVSKKAISGYMTILPPLPLQQAFAEKVKAIERQKELINQSIKDVQTLYYAKMDYYFGD